MTRKNWKIKNISDKQIKLAVAISSHGAPGVILQAGQFCLSIDQMTAPIDAQMRRGLVEIEKDFDNSNFKLELAKAYDEIAITDKKAEEIIIDPIEGVVDTETVLDVAVKETEEYQNTPLTKEDLGNIIW